MTNHQLCQYIISSFLKSQKDISWPREMKMAQKIVKEYPDPTFWKSVDKNIKYNSLNFFLSEDGKKFLISQKNLFDFKLKEPDNIVLEEHKVAEDVKIPVFKATIMDFLKK